MAQSVSYPCWVENKDFLIEENCLGMGSFCRVDLIQRCPQEEMKLNSSDNFQEEEEEEAKYYALKRVRTDLESPSQIRQGRSDLQLECCILQTLSSHPNIIRLHSIGRETNDDQNSNSPLISYLVLDRLYNTVLDKVEGEWLERRGYYGFHEQIGLDQPAQEKLWDERVDVIRQIANALLFIHQHNIVYRDIKAENVGFVCKGISHHPQKKDSNRIKLFDFGLAKSLQNLSPVQNDEYNLTKFTGTFIYMSPEILKRKPYGKKTDIYSFALVCYHILSLRQPFQYIESFPGMYDEVIRMKRRPNLDVFWPPQLRKLIISMWDECPQNRPSSELALERLNQLPKLYPSIPLWPIGKLVNLFTK